MALLNLVIDNLPFKNISGRRYGLLNKHSINPRLNIGWLIFGD